MLLGFGHIGEDMIKTEILRILRNAAGYVSGQALCNRLAVSRTAIWKVINQLKDEGYVIDSVQNKGYRIISYPDVLTAEEILSRLGEETLVDRIFTFDKVDSTNVKARLFAEEGAAHGTVVIAEQQTNAKGRRGKSWETVNKTSIAMSVVLRPDTLPVLASMLTLVMGMSVVEACSQVLHVETQIKWPNDVVLNNKKICGILTEMSAEIDYINYIVVGTGINVNMDSFQEEIADIATSLKLETGQSVMRSELTAAVLECFEVNYKAFIEQQDLRFMLEKYNKALVSFEKPVRVLDLKKEYNGISLGINKKGELIVKKEDGTVTSVYSGEVSVRGLYGYV